MKSQGMIAPHARERNETSGGLSSGRPDQIPNEDRVLSRPWPGHSSPIPGPAGRPVNRRRTGDASGTPDRAPPEQRGIAAGGASLP